MQYNSDGNFELIDTDERSSQLHRYMLAGNYDNIVYGKKISVYRI